DGFVGVIAGPDHNWSAMAELTGIPELDDPKFGDRSGRAENADELDALMLPWLMQHGKREIFERAQELGLAFAYVADPSDILGWEHLQERGFFTEVEHSEAGTYQYPTGPFLSDGMTWDLSPAPTLGQHNREVYCDLLGHSNDQHIRLRENGVV
ncbi:MAG: CoA transferase, partial [Chloroflexi bacterium]|nr:CoA transferase [Chloroflexota bacterium]